MRIRAPRKVFELLITASGVSAVSGRVPSAFPTASDHNFPSLKIEAEIPIFLESFSNSELSAFEKELSSASSKRANEVNDSNFGVGVLIIGIAVVVVGVAVVVVGVAVVVVVVGVVVVGVAVVVVGVAVVVVGVAVVVVGVAVVVVGVAVVVVGVAVVVVGVAVVVVGVAVVVVGVAVVVVGVAVVVVGVAVVGVAAVMVSEVPPQEASKAKEIRREIFFIDNDHFFFCF
ncbi:MAG: hypothetical protein ACJZ17_00010 [Acidimicrobiales bacterium]